MNADRNPLTSAFGDNLRVIEWMLKRQTGKVDAVDTPIGHLPRPQDLNTAGLETSEAELRELLHVDPVLWQKEVEAIRGYFSQFGSRVPAPMTKELDAVEKRLNQPRS